MGTSAVMQITEEKISVKCGAAQHLIKIIIIIIHKKKKNQCCENLWY